MKITGIVLEQALEIADAEWRERGAVSPYQDLDYGYLNRVLQILGIEIVGRHKLRDNAEHNARS